MTAAEDPRYLLPSARRASARGLIDSFRSYLVRAKTASAARVPHLAQPAGADALPQRSFRLRPICVTARSASTSRKPTLLLFVGQRDGALVFVVEEPRLLGRSHRSTSFAITSSTCDLAGELASARRTQYRQLVQRVRGGRRSRSHLATTLTRGRSDVDVCRAAMPGTESSTRSRWVCRWGDLSTRTRDGQPALECRLAF